MAGQLEGPCKKDLGLCPGPNVPLQGPQGSQACIPDSPRESGLVSKGSKGLCSPFELRRAPLGHLSLSCIGEGNGSPLQCSCLGQGSLVGHRLWGRTELDTTASANGPPPRPAPPGFVPALPGSRRVPSHIGHPRDTVTWQRRKCPVSWVFASV